MSSICNGGEENWNYARRRPHSDESFTTNRRRLAHCFQHNKAHDKPQPVRIGAYDEVLTGARYVSSDIVERATVAWTTELDRVFPGNTPTLTDQSEDRFKYICSIVRCGPNHWLVRHRETGQLSVRIDPFGPNKAFVVVPCWSSTTINAASLTDDVRAKYLLVVPQELRDMFGSLDAYIEKDGYCKFFVLPKLVTTRQDDRPTRDFGPELVVDFRNKSMFDAFVLASLLVVTECPGWWTELHNLKVATDVEDTLRGDKRSMFRRPYAKFIAAAEAVLRREEFLKLGITTFVADSVQANGVEAVTREPAGAMEEGLLREEEEQQIVPSRGRRRNQTARWLIVGSALMASAITVVSFVVRDSLNSDPLSVLFAAISLNVVVPPIFRDRYAAGLSVVEVIIGRLQYTTEGRKSPVKMDEAETVECLDQIAVHENMSRLLAPDNLCYHKGSSEFSGKLLAEPVEVSLLPERYHKVITGVGLPVIEGPSGRAVLDVGSSSQKLLHFKDLEDSSAHAFKWKVIRCKVG
eukprot:GFKZ01013200.1.p1 GENE.GFKZ01013200.1~~GFKZ01013200.1.p1  ORF type:complete len:522 (+),score=40.35 GFKZ01013200.1:95-1660(+)